MSSLSPRLRLLLGLAPAFIVFSLLGLSTAHAAPTRQHVAPGTVLDVTRPYPSSVLHVVVVRPGIAVGTDSAASVDPQFLTNVKLMLDTIADVPAGKALLDGFANMVPLTATDGSPAIDSAVVFRDYATSARVDINVVIEPGDWMARPLSHRSDPSGAAAEVFADPQSLVMARNPGMTDPFMLTPDTALFHELLHAAHTVAASRAEGSQVVAVQVTNPATGKSELVGLPTEEARTHGSLAELYEANGGQTLPNGKIRLNPNPLEVTSIEQAAAATSAALAVLRSKGGDTPANRAVAEAASKNLGGRQLVAGLTERRYVLQRGLIDRHTYGRFTQDTTARRMQLESADDFPELMRQVATHGQEIQLHPENAGVPIARVEYTLPCGPASAAECDLSEAPPVSDEQKRAQEEFDRSVTEHGEPTVESAAEAVVGELTPAELAAYAGARIATEPGFTSDLGDAWKSGKVFVPTGKATASKLVEGWRFANEAALGVNVILWIKGLVEAFQSDSTDLDKSTAVLALVPGVGQILGILDGLEHKDPASVVSNVTALLSFALDFVGQPELALVFGVVSFVTAIVDTFLNMDPNDARYQSYASWNIEGRRDSVWKTQIAKGLLERTIPALVTAADAAFQSAQRQIVYSGDLVQASIDASVAGASVGARNAAVSAKAHVRAATQGSVDSLRTGFVGGSQGVEAAIRNAVAKLNGGDGFGDFTHSYLQQVERPEYVLAMYTGCRNGDSQTDDIPDDAQALACSERKPFYGEHFDSVVEPQIQASKSPGGLVAATYVAAVDAEIQKQSAFSELEIGDTDPSLVTQGQAASITSALGGACLQRDGKGGQVSTRTAGQCESLGWTVNPDHTITARDGLCLDAAGAGTSPGTRVITWDCTGRANQRWTFNANGTITGDQSGLCLDITGGPVELSSCTGGADQRWSYRATPYPDSLISAVNGAGKLAETVTGGVGLAPAAEGVLDDQQWTYVLDGSAGRLMNAYDNKCLQASAHVASLVDCKAGEADQQWMLLSTSSGEGFQIRNMTRGVCLNTDATLGACTSGSAWRMTPNLTATPARHDHSYIRITTPGAE